MTEAPTTAWRNWSGLVTARPGAVESPASTAEVAEIVTRAAAAGQAVKPVGAGHSFSDIAAPTTSGVQLDMTRLDRLRSVDPATGLVTVEAGIRLSELSPLLAEHGLALENMGDIDRQTISGATATGTHGTGLRFGSISTQLRGLELVLADGSVVQCSATSHPDLFAAARVNLGALGVVTAVTLQCVPAYALECVEEVRPLEEVLELLEHAPEEHDHVEAFWFPHSKLALTKTMTRLPLDTPTRGPSPARAWVDRELVERRLFGGLLGLGSRVPRLVPPLTRFAATQFGGGTVVDTSYKVFASPREVRFNEGEYAVPRTAVVPALKEVRDWVASHDEPVSFPLEVRFVAGDDITLSPARGRDSGYIAFHQFHRMPHERYFSALEGLFAGHDGRPHWGKLHSLTAAELSTRLPGFAEFVALRDRLDPTGVFANAYLDRVLGPAPEAGR